MRSVRWLVANHRAVELLRGPLVGVSAPDIDVISCEAAMILAEYASVVPSTGELTHQVGGWRWPAVMV